MVIIFADGPVISGARASADVMMFMFTSTTENLHHNAHMVVITTTFSASSVD